MAKKKKKVKVLNTSPGRTGDVLLLGPSAGGGTPIGAALPGLSVGVDLAAGSIPADSPGFVSKFLPSLLGGAVLLVLFFVFDLGFIWALLIALAVGFAVALLRGGSDTAGG